MKEIKSVNINSITEFMKKCNICSTIKDFNDLYMENKIYNIQLTPIVIISEEGEDIFYSLKLRYLNIFISTTYIIKPTTNKKEFDRMLFYFIQKSKDSFWYLKYTIDTSIEYRFSLLYEQVIDEQENKIYDSMCIKDDCTMISDLTMFLTFEIYKLIVNDPTPESKEKSAISISSIYDIKNKIINLFH